MIDFTVHAELEFKFEKVEITNAYAEQIEFTFKLDRRVSSTTLRMFCKTDSFKKEMSILLKKYSHDNWPEIVNKVSSNPWFNNMGLKNTVWAYVRPGCKQALITVRVNQKPTVPWTIQDIELFNWF